MPPLLLPDAHIANKIPAILFQLYIFCNKMIITVFPWRYILRVKANIKIWYLVICQFLQWICREIAPNFRYPQGTEVLQFCIFPQQYSLLYNARQPLIPLMTPAILYYAVIYGTELLANNLISQCFQLSL